MAQGELFRQEHQGSEIVEEIKKSFFSRHQVTIRFDYLMVLIIALAVVVVLTYSFGVERGKRFMEAKLVSLIPVHGQTLMPTVQKALNPGVETSSALAEVKASDEIQDEVQKETVLIVNEEKADEEPEENENHLLVDKSRKSDFTIQLVTYTDKELARREALRLKSKGQEGFIIPSGKYYQVCANYFKNRTQARSNLDYFRATGRYADAYIRPVIR